MMQAPVSLAEIKLTLLAAGVQYEDLDASLDWAFGNRDIAIRDWVKTWNSRHLHIFEMKGSDSIFDIVFRIGRAYAQNHYGVKPIPCIEVGDGYNRGTVQAASQEQNGSSSTTKEETQV